MLKRDELSDPASCMNYARDDEMVFVLLGRDPAAPAAIRQWIRARVMIGKNKRDDDLIIDAHRCANTMDADRYELRLKLGKPKE